MCEKHIDVFISLAIYWVYNEHQAVMYVNPNNELPDKIMWYDDLQDVNKDGTLQTTVEIGPKDYSDELYDPEAKGFARPRSKHLKVYPRWTGMETNDADEKHGDVHTLEGLDELEDTPPPKNKPTEMDYASKSIIWDSSNVYTKS